MGYVDVSPPDISSPSLKTAFLAVLDDGVDYSSDGIANENAKAALIKNMWLQNGVLTARKQLTDTGCFIESDRIHSDVRCFGYQIIHAGECIYAVNAGECRKLYSDVPDQNSFFVEFEGKLYLYCGIYVFSVNKELEVTEELPYCPVFSEVCSRDTGLIAHSDNLIPNMLAPIAKVYYGSGGSSANNYFRFPENMDLTKRFYIYINDKLIDSSGYTVSGNKFYLNGDFATGESRAVSICFYSTDAIFEKCGILSDCRIATTFGGTVQGTRVICAGNPEYPGRYFLSELSQPLCFLADSGGSAGNGTEDIVAFSKQYSELLMFTESTVSRMRYNYTSENGGYYSVHLINSAVGCDVPESVCSVDNRTVFANSTNGIYIVDSTDGNDMLNILPISLNIADSSGANGYFSVTAQERKNGRAVVYDGKYMLHAGSKVFIWDYRNSPYVSSSDYGMAAKRLTWFEFDGFENVRLLFGTSEGLYALTKGEENKLCICGFTENGEKCLYVYRSANSGLGYPQCGKYVLSFRFDGRTEKKTDCYVSFYADGLLYEEIKAKLVPGKDGYANFSARIPKFSARHFAFEIKSTDADVGIMNVGFEYIIRKDIEIYTK